MALVRPFGQSGLVIPANAAQNTLDRVVGGLGPEMARAFDNSWTLDLKGGAAGTVTQDTTGVTFAAANNITAAYHASEATMIDGATYEVTYTITNWTAGTHKFLIYGNTTNHGGFAVASRSGNGTWTERVTLNATATTLNRVMFQATGASGQNSFKLAYISCRRVL